MNSKLPVNVDIQDIWQKDKDHVIHPWTDFTTFKEEGSLIMSKGENVFVYDIHGNKYLDGIGGLWCVNVGYGRRKLRMQYLHKLWNFHISRHLVIKLLRQRLNWRLNWLSMHQKA
jgi:adenosylmethionine-8-amino-7-oxononanoate aminotransferase